jgi:hypothetical protein
MSLTRFSTSFELWLCAPSAQQNPAIRMNAKRVAVFIGSSPLIKFFDFRLAVSRFRAAAVVGIGASLADC